MFGVLVARDAEGHTILLKAFSGSCQGHRNLPGWVSHIVEESEYQDYMERYDQKIKDLGSLLEKETMPENRSYLAEKRANLSREALKHYQGLYHIATINKEYVALDEIFTDGKIPTGSGDCCAIKLLHHAFSHDLHPISMTEFFFGSPTKDSNRQHLSYYGPCDEKCKPILHVMLGLDIVYQDASIVLINKDPGMLSVPGRGADKADCVETRIRTLFPDSPKQCAVHRLDMDTSGLLLLAKTKQAYLHLHRQFREKGVQKVYVALLEGIVKKEEGEIHLPFRLDPNNRPYQVYDEVQGKWGTTLFKRLAVERNDDGKLVTRMQFNPLTGRTHQLRLHSAHQNGLGSPICGDRLYGSGGADRLYLHAQFLKFRHPKTEEWLEFTILPCF